MHGPVARRAGGRVAQKGLRENREAMAETIENNVHRLIIDEMAVNPKYYEKIYELLDAPIAQRRQEALDYKVYLAKIVQLTNRSSIPNRFVVSTLDRQCRATRPLRQFGEAACWDGA